MWLPVTSDEIIVLQKKTIRLVCVMAPWWVLTFVDAKSRKCQLQMKVIFTILFSVNLHNPRKYTPLDALQCTVHGCISFSEKKI